MTPTILTYLILCPLTFLAGFVDSAAGGGGLISLPAYLFAGLPIHLAYGTNKFSACSGAIAATIRYFKSGRVLLRLALIAGGAALVGSWMGAHLALLLSAEILQMVLMVVLPVVALFLLTNKGFGAEGKQKQLSPRAFDLIGLACGLVLGAYDGFFGPGTGTFLVLAFTGLLGLDLVSASGTARAVNLASNIAAVATFILNGKVLYAVAIPCALCAIGGGMLGSKMAIKGGAKFIRPMIAVVVVLLLAKVLLEFFA